ncbi:hypothetical protein HAX54_005427, partial [Datura stramonium]|nr:hypothetical protein [Datura stramonium]
VSFGIQGLCSYHDIGFRRYEYMYRLKASWYDSYYLVVRINIEIYQHGSTDHRGSPRVMVRAITLVEKIFNAGSLG